VTTLVLLLNEALRRVKNFAICLDQLGLNIITLGHSAPDETMSAAAYRLEQAGKWQGKVFRPLLDGILFFDPQHCFNAWESEVYGRQQAKANRYTTVFVSKT